jgi:DNA-binding transcriptional regulator YbjK
VTEAGSASAKSQQATDAALAVLAAKGSRGLTHRAVDEAAGLPSGSTSNYFRTRSALLEAAQRRHVELDLPPASLLDQVGDGRLSKEQAKGLIMAALTRVLEPEGRPLVAARYELILEATRREGLRRQHALARQRIVDLAELALRASGCRTPDRHAAQLVAVMDGIALDQLMEPDSSLDRAGIGELIDRLLDTC